MPGVSRDNDTAGGDLIPSQTTVFANGEEIIKLPDGSLTTVYHHLKNRDIAIEQELTSTKLEGIEV